MTDRKTEVLSGKLEALIKLAIDEACDHCPGDTRAGDVQLHSNKCTNECHSCWLEYLKIDD